MKKYLLTICYLLIPMMVHATTLTDYQQSDWSTDGQTLFVGKDNAIYECQSGDLTSCTLWYTFSFPENSNTCGWAGLQGPLEATGAVNNLVTPAIEMKPETTRDRS